MNKPATHNMAETDPARFQRICMLGEIINNQLMMLDPHLRLEVLIYVIASTFMEVKPLDGHTKLTAFDHYMASARETIEKNLALQAQQEQSREH